MRMFELARKWQITVEGLALLWKIAEFPGSVPKPLAAISAGHEATLREFYTKALMSGALLEFQTFQGKVRRTSEFEPWQVERMHRAQVEIVMKKHAELMDHFRAETITARQTANLKTKKAVPRAGRKVSRSYFQSKNAPPT